MSNSQVDAWFIREVLTMDAALSRFLRRHWCIQSDITDLRQETYLRVYEAAMRQIPAHARAFVIAIARNLVIDWVRRKKIASFETVGNPERFAAFADERSAEDHASIRQEVSTIETALECLPPRCRQMFRLHRIEGHSQRDVAALLGVTESTVEKHVQIARRRLRSLLDVEAKQGKARPVRSKAVRQSVLRPPVRRSALAYPRAMESRASQLIGEHR